MLDFADGSDADGAQVTHSFTQAGTYEVILTVDDGVGTACSTHQDQTRIFVNAAPVAEAGPDQVGYVGGAHDALLFDATDSHDPDGDPLSFTWDFGDGQTAQGAYVSHLYGQPGTYTVTLTARDDTGTPCGSVTDTLTVTVQPRN